MKFIWLAFIIVTMTYSVKCFTEEQLEMKNALRKNCIDETGIDIAMLEAVDGGAVLTPDPKLKCYLKCTFESFGAFDEGSIDMAPTLEIMPDDMKAILGPIFKNCGTIKGEDDCDTVYLTNKCFQDANPKFFFMV